MSTYLIGYICLGYIDVANDAGKCHLVGCGGTIIDIYTCINYLVLYTIQSILHLVKLMPVVAVNALASLYTSSFDLRAAATQLIAKNTTVNTGYLAVKPGCFQPFSWE